MLKWGNAVQINGHADGDAKESNDDGNDHEGSYFGVGSYLRSRCHVPAKIAELTLPVASRPGGAFYRMLFSASTVVLNNGEDMRCRGGWIKLNIEDVTPIRTIPARSRRIGRWRATL